MEMEDAMEMPPWLKLCFLKKLNKFISFDRLNGILECESGVLLSEILEITVIKARLLLGPQELNLLPLEELLLLTFMGKITMLEGSFRNA